MCRLCYSPALAPGSCPGPFFNLPVNSAPGSQVRLQDYRLGGSGCFRPIKARFLKELVSDPVSSDWSDPDLSYIYKDQSYKEEYFKNWYIYRINRGDVSKINFT